MSSRESKRVFVMERVLGAEITCAQAASLLGLSVRHVRRLKKEMKLNGLAALAHKNRGRKPAHALRSDVRKRILELATGIMKGASCIHTSEVLLEDYGIRVSPRTVRRVLTAAGVAYLSRRAPRRRRSRERMPREGMLVQIDATPHAWLEDRGPAFTLHGALDDATGKVLGLYFTTNECLLGYLQVLDQILKNHGVPVSLYSDQHTIFFSPKALRLTIEDELAGRQRPTSQFGMVLQELGVNQIAAHSPQAKGRIERLWATLHRRLMIDMRRAGVENIEQANAFLPEFIRKHNLSFGVEPAVGQSAFRPVPPTFNPYHSLASRTSRKASRGSTIALRGQTLQLVNSKGVPVSLTPSSTVEIRTLLDGKTLAFYRGKPYSLKEIKLAPKGKAVAPKAQRAPVRPPKPAADHPWKRGLPGVDWRKVDPVERFFHRKDPADLFYHSSD